MLLILIKDSNTEAFEALYERYFVRLCRSAFSRIQNEDVVEELVQDVFINLWLKRSALDDAGEVAAYLFATLRNKVLHELRREMINTRNLVKLQQEATIKYTTDTSDQLEAKEAEERIQLVLQGLSPKSREAFTLSRFNQLSYKAIAQQMNISVNTVEKHIGKALIYLKKRV
jgi:RNA polymerase sigma-70 factor (ECF subfamily)